jgi:hypothetical protein
MLRVFGRLEVDWRWSRGSKDANFAGCEVSAPESPTPPLQKIRRIFPKQAHVIAHGTEMDQLPDCL